MIVVPVVVLQFVIVYVFYDRHWSSVKRHMISALAGDIAFVVESTWHSDPESRIKMLTVMNNTLYLQVRFLPGAHLSDFSIEKREEISILASEVRRKIPLAFTIFEDKREEAIITHIQMADGILRIVMPRKRFENPSTYIFFLWVGGASFILLVVAILFMRNQVRSISRLAYAAERFGKGEDVVFKPSGAKEVRLAGQAFVEMKERIRKQMGQRMEMLTNISHDIKTPLTRMKLQLAMMKKDKAVDELEYDLKEMERMVRGYLDFASGQKEEPCYLTGLPDFLRGIIARYRNRQDDIELSIQAGIKVNIRTESFKRAVMNVIDNALAYAKHLSIHGSVKEDKMELLFDDDGPGIPPTKRELVFKPFYRLDPSRNTETGGVGLGLSIVRDIIMQHGGEIALEDSPKGGLRVRVVIPV